MPLDEAILSALEGVEGIGTLVVFGSRAQGRERTDSDLDVAVLPSIAGDSPRRRLQSDIASRLTPLVPSGRVDVVLLDEAPELLRQRVMESGRVLACAEERAWQQLRVATMREHGDREYYRDLMRRAQHARLTGGKASGRSGRVVESLGRVGKLPG